MIVRAVLAAAVLAAGAACAAPLGPVGEARRPPTVSLAPCRIPGADTLAHCGTHPVVVANGSARDLDLGCVEALRRPPFVAALPAPRPPR